MSIINNIKNFIITGRPQVSVISGLLSSLMICTDLKSFAIGLLYTFPITLVTMLGFVFNDLYDIKKDRIAQKNRPITTGVLSVKNAVYLSLIFSIITLSCSYYLNTFISFLIIIVTLIAVLLYSPFSSKIPLMKIFYTALLCCTPLIYGYFLADTLVNIYALFPIFVFIIGRELWLDKIDLDGDLLSSIKTMPYYLGNKKSTYFSFILMFLGTIGLFFFVKSYLGTVLIIFTLLSILICCIISLKDENKAVSFSKISMILGILVICFG